MNHRIKLTALLGTLLCAGVSSAFAQSATTTFSYNARGQLTSTTTPAGRTHSLGWDTLGRNISQSGPGYQVGMGYNGQDRLATVVDPIDPAR